MTAAGHPCRRASLNSGKLKKKKVRDLAPRGGIRIWEWGGSSGSLGMEVPIGTRGKAPTGGLGTSPQKLVIFYKLYHSEETKTVLPTLSLFAVARPSVVCLSVVWNVRAPYSCGSNFRRYFYGIRYPGHPLTSAENFTKIVPGEPLRRGS